MPYLRGYELEDASSTALADASAVAIAEPDRDFGTIQNAAAAILLPEGLAGIASAVTGLVLTAADIYNLLDQVFDLIGLAPTGAPSLFQTAYNASQDAEAAHTVLDNITSPGGQLYDILPFLQAMQGSGSHTIEEIYLLPNLDADTIWQWRPTVTDEQMYTLLQAAGRFGSRVADIGAIAVQNAPGFLLTGPWDASDTNELPTDWPQVDWSGIAADDTLESYLDSADPAHTWTTDEQTGMVSAASTHANSVGWYWVCRLTPAEFEHFKSVATDAGNVPPTWPGIDAVTLGTPVVITGPTVVDGPMDGLLWETTTAPAGRSRFSVGGNEYAYHAGSLAFVSDNGDIEPYQYIGWDAGLFAARQMKRAASALVAPGRDITGVATPWTIT